MSSPTAAPSSSSQEVECDFARWSDIDLKKKRKAPKTHLEFDIDAERRRSWKMSVLPFSLLAWTALQHRSSFSHLTEDLQTQRQETCRQRRGREAFTSTERRSERRSAGQSRQERFYCWTAKWNDGFTRWNISLFLFIFLICDRLPHLDNFTCR